MSGALPTLSLENRLGTFCRAQGISMDFVAAVLDQKISSTRLRIALRGEQSLGGEDTKAVETLLGELKAIAAEHLPFKIQWGNPAFFREELERRKQKSQLIEHQHKSGGCNVAEQVQVEGSYHYSEHDDVFNVKVGYRCPFCSQRHLQHVTGSGTAPNGVLIRTDCGQQCFVKPYAR